MSKTAGAKLRWPRHSIFEFAKTGEHKGRICTHPNEVRKISVPATGSHPHWGSIGISPFGVNAKTGVNRANGAVPVISGALSL